MRIATHLTLFGLLASAALGQSSERPRDAVGATPGSAAIPRSAATRVSAAHLLNMRMPEIAFEDAAIEDVFDSIAQITGTNVVVRWRRLEEVGIERDTKISLRARNLRLSQVLWVILSDFDAQGSRLAYRADSDMLLITTAEELGEEMIVRIYDVNDLLMPIEAVRPTISFGRVRQYVQTVQPEVAAGAVGVRPVIGTLTSGLSLWGDTNPWDGEFGQNTANDDAEGDIEAARARRLQQLLDAITSAIEPETWDVNGGPGSVREFRGMLIVRNTPLVHQKIGGPIVESDRR